MKRIVTIIVTLLLFLINPMETQAQTIHGVFMPKVGISKMVSRITVDQAKWAYAKEFSKQMAKQAASQKELRLMSAIIWCEAGNQCEAGKQAVGIVVMNRVDSTDFANTIEGVIYEKGQFSPKDDGRLNIALRMYDQGEIPEECIAAAKWCLENNKVVIYNGIKIDMSEIYFFARSLKNPKIIIQDHSFR